MIVQDTAKKNPGYSMQGNGAYPRCAGRCNVASGYIRQVIMTQLSMARHPQLFHFHFQECLARFLAISTLWRSSQWYLVGYFTAINATMSNFEPNAVIRGFQLTVVGSMSLVFFLFPDHSGELL
jgi:hypothetical protein